MIQRGTVYHFVLTSVSGRLSQATLDGGTLVLLDDLTRIVERLRVTNETALGILAARSLRRSDVAGITVRKVAGPYTISEIERSVMWDLVRERL